MHKISYKTIVTYIYTFMNHYHNYAGTFKAMYICTQFENYIINKYIYMHTQVQLLLMILTINNILVTLSAVSTNGLPHE